MYSFGGTTTLALRACACMGIPALQPSALCLKGWRPIGMSLLGSEGSQGHLPSKLKLRRQVGTCGVWTGTWTTGSGCPPGPPPPPVAPVLPVTSPASPSPYKSFGFFVLDLLEPTLVFHLTAVRVVVVSLHFNFHLHCLLSTSQTRLLIPCSVLSSALLPSSRTDSYHVR